MASFCRLSWFVSITLNNWYKAAINSFTMQDRALLALSFMHHLQVLCAIIWLLKGMYAAKLDNKKHGTPNLISMPCFSY